MGARSRKGKGTSGLILAGRGVGGESQEVASVRCRWKPGCPRGQGQGGAGNSGWPGPVSIQNSELSMFSPERHLLGPWGEESPANRSEGTTAFCSLGGRQTPLMTGPRAGGSGNGAQDWSLKASFSTRSCACLALGPGEKTQRAAPGPEDYAAPGE